MRRVSQQDVNLVKGSGLFDEQWYLEKYRDVDMVGMDPVEHYLWLGWRLKRSPSPKFCVRSYLDAYRDIAAANIDPLLHYLRFGQQEGRLIFDYVPNAMQGREKAARNVTRWNIPWDDKLSEKTRRDLSAVGGIFSNDLVSIVMPARNREFCIGDAIRSVLAQTHTNYELIVIDDGSTDGTSQVAASFNDPRIRCIRNNGDNGVSRARNIGLESAEGKWVFFLDSDNTWDPQMIELMLKHAVMARVSSGYCAADLLDDNVARKAVLYTDFDFESCLRENFIDLNCLFVRWEGDFRKLRFNETLRRLVDWEFILQVAARTRVIGTPYIGVKYSDGTGPRITNSEFRDKRMFLELMEQVRQIGRQAALDAPVIQDLSSYRVAVVMHLFYPDMVSECIVKLKNIPFEFDLFVTTSLGEGEQAFKEVLSAFPSAKIFHYPNYGADIAPFMELVSTLKTYFMVGKIHTKRDVGKWGATWRNELLDSVLKSAEHVERVVAAFRANKDLKLVCSKVLYKHGVLNSVPQTRTITREIAADIGVSDHLEKDWAFVAGTMFWARPQYLLKLGRYMCESGGYSTQFRRDGAIEHGIERMIGLSLWDDPASQVGLTSEDNSLEIFPLGEGHVEEGVSQTLTRMSA